jgi:Sec1 family
MASAATLSPSRANGGGGGSGSTNAAMSPTRHASNSNAEATVILPPPSSSNPIPSLSAAFRLDNQQQLLDILCQHPKDVSKSVQDFRQLLVFADASFRTLLLRQVLSDPHTRTFSNTKKKKLNKNWDVCNHFPLPKALQSNVVGSKVLLEYHNNNDNDTTPRATKVGLELPPHKTSAATKNTLNPFAATGIATDNYASDLYWSAQDATSEHIDVVTYLLKPFDLDHTLAAIRRIQLSSKDLHHRFVYVPQITAAVAQVLQDTGLAASSNVSITSLQLDIFPLESDLFSLEIPSTIDSLLETPSQLVSTTARALLKLQDVTGMVSRIQSLGSDDVVAKLLNMTVDESILAERTNNQDNTEYLDNPQKWDAAAINTNVTMMIVDRQLDLVTPMVTPLTYEGLLDEVVGIRHGFVELDEQVIHPDGDDAETKESNKNPFDDGDAASKKQIALGVHAGDTLYAEVRDQHVEKFGSFLQNQALALKESHSNFTSKGTKKDLNEIHQFVKQIPVSMIFCPSEDSGRDLMLRPYANALTSFTDSKTRLRFLRKACAL